MANLLDNVIGFFAPGAGLKRVQKRTAMELATRRYEAAGGGRRLEGLSTTPSGPNVMSEISLNRLRARVRDLERNNVWAKQAIRRVTTNTVGTGINPKIDNKKARKLWKEWAETKKCDYDQHHNIYGLQKLAMMAIARDGEVIIRRRRVKGDVPIKLQVQEADVIDSGRNFVLQNGGRIVQGVEFDADNQRVAYWLFDTHPNDNLTYTPSRRIPADDVIHVFEKFRPGQVRGIPWLAATIIRLKDFDEYEDAEIIRQKIASCFTVFVEDANPEAAETNEDGLSIDRIEPGIIEMLPPGKTVTFAQPPTTANYEGFSKNVLRGSAAGIGISYEALTGDLSNVNFSSGRMGWIEMQRNIEDWQYNMLVPMLCDSIWEWFVMAGMIKGSLPMSLSTAITWTPPRREMIDPSKEIAAQINAVRGGLISLQEVHRQNGYDSEKVFEEIASDNERIDKLGFIFDSDARKTMKAGVTQAFLKTPSDAAGFEDPEPEQAPTPPTE